MDEIQRQINSINDLRPKTSQLKNENQIKYKNKVPKDKIKKN